MVVQTGKLMYNSAKRKFNFGKLIVVVFLTLLIWIWADLAIDEEWVVPNAKLDIAKPANQALLAAFEGGDQSISIDEIVFKAPASKIADVRRAYSKGAIVFEFFVSPEQEYESKGTYTLNLGEFLQKNDQIRELGLTVESVEPKTINIVIKELVKKILSVQVFDEQNYLIRTAAITPDTIEMYVPDEWEGQALTAKVQLSRGEREQARTISIQRKPSILIDGQKREAAAAVKITVPPEGDPRQDFRITNVTCGIVLSTNTQGRFKVEILNESATLGYFDIRATQEARNAYENQLFQVLLEIDDEKDLNASGTIRRPLVYNFPDEYVEKNEIELKGQPQDAEFRLIPLESPQENGKP